LRTSSPFAHRCATEDMPGPFWDFPAPRSAALCARHREVLASTLAQSRSHRFSPVVGHFRTHRFQRASSHSRNCDILLQLAAEVKGVRDFRNYYCEAQNQMQVSLAFSPSPGKVPASRYHTCWDAWPQDPPPSGVGVVAFSSLAHLGGGRPAADPAPFGSRSAETATTSAKSASWFDSPSKFNVLFRHHPSAYPTSRHIGEGMRASTVTSRN